MTNNPIQVTFKLKYLPASVCDVLRADKSLMVGVMGSIPELGSWNPCRMLRAEPPEDGVWRTVSRVPIDSSFTWTWVVTARDGHVIFSDRVGQRETTLSCFSGILETIWGSHESHFVAQISGFMMRVHYHCQRDLVLALVGSGVTLGSWDPKNAILAKQKQSNSSIWTVAVLLDNTVQLYEWKWIVIDKKSGNVDRWEERNNRHLEPQFDGLVTLVDTRWNSDFRCEHRGTFEQVNRYLYSLESSNAEINWFDNANCTMLPFGGRFTDLHMLMFEIFEFQTLSWSRWRQQRRQKNRFGNPQSDTFQPCYCSFTNGADFREYVVSGAERRVWSECGCTTLGARTLQAELDRS